MAHPIREDAVTQSKDYFMLHKLANAIEILSLEECDIAIDQFYDLAPDLKQKNYLPDEFELLSEDLVDHGLPLNTRMLRPIITGYIELQRNDDVHIVSILELHDLMRVAVGSSSEYMEAYDCSSKQYFEDELEKGRSRVGSIKTLINTARLVGEVAIAEDLLPELAKREAHVRVLKDRRDELARQAALDLEGSRSVVSKSEEHPLKREQASM